MATVWTAKHVTMDSLVAVKIMSAELADCELAVTRFRTEARAAAKLRSPYVVQLHDHDIDPELGPYIAMELLEGENLAERLDRERTLSPKALCSIFEQVCKGLTRAHTLGIVHRDMKPDNVFLAVDDDGVETAKILDFGVAKSESPFALQGNQRTVAGALVGTLDYMSPEQAQGREVDHLTDLWALGVIAFESLVGQRPFGDDAPGAVVVQICAKPIPVPSKIEPNVPPGFDEWFATACNRDPAQRFSSAEELAASLLEVCDATELSIGDVLSTEEPWKPPSLPRVEEAPAPSKETPPNKEGKRPVLMLVESTYPPPEPRKPMTSESLDIEIEHEPEYFVSDGSVTVGPLGLATLRVGYQEGYVPGQALLWTDGWKRWREASDVFATETQRERSFHDLEIIGPRCAMPDAAPALPAGASKHMG